MEIGNYSLDRKAAGKVLKVSIRTVDRYVKAKKISSKVINGRIWLDKKEVVRFRDLVGQRGTVDAVDMSTPKMSIDDSVDMVDNVELIDGDNLSTFATKKRSRSGENAVYKNLFNELKEEVREKQERLEIANYRVGQLEAQVKNSIPMLEYHREKFTARRQEEELSEKISQQESVITRLAKKLKYEKISKRMFLVILMIIIALQPLWLILIYK